MEDLPELFFPTRIVNCDNLMSILSLKDLKFSTERLVSIEAQHPSFAFVMEATPQISQILHLFKVSCANIASAAFTYFTFAPPSSS
jgi:hypothetical protein